MDKGEELEPSHIPLDQILREIGKTFTIVTAEEEVTADIHGIIDYTIEGLSVDSTGFISNENDIVVIVELI